MRGNIGRATAALVAAALGFGAGGAAQAATVAQILEASHQFATLSRAVAAAGMAETLGGEEPLTLFAPTDQAFEQMGDAELAELFAEDNRDRLRDILAHHLVPGEAVGEDDFAGRAVRLETAAGEPLVVDGTGTPTSVGNAEIVNPSIQADNGVIHIINAVLLPSEPPAPAAEEPQRDPTSDRLIGGGDREPIER